MRKIIHWVHTSVDGFVNGPGGAFDWPVMGPELSDYSDGLDERVDTLLFGRPVWEMMVGFWPEADQQSDHPHITRFAPFWRATPKIVVSRSYAGDAWAERVIGADLAAEVAELKRQPGRDILLTGGAAVGAALAGHGLLDECHVAVHPVVLGGGRRLFPGLERRLHPEPVASRLVDGRVVVTQYNFGG